MIKYLMDQQRPAIPAPGDLPGPGSGDWWGLDAYLSLMQRCWAEDPAARPDFVGVLEELEKLARLRRLDSGSRSMSARRMRFD